MTAVKCGPTRNLSPLFLKLRAVHKTTKNRFTSRLLEPSTNKEIADDGGFSFRRRSLKSREGLLSSQHNDSFGTYEEDARSSLTQTLPPSWVDVVEEANDDLSKAKEKLSALQKVQQQRLLRIFGDNTSQQQPEREVETLVIQITELLRKCDAKIHELGLLTASQHIVSMMETKHGSLADAEIKLRKNAQRNIATQLQSISKQMRLQQQHYVAELRKRHLLDNDDDVTTATSCFQTPLPDGSGKFEAGQVTEMLSDQILMSQLEELEHTSDIRHREIARIAQSMAELHGIFKDLNMLVVDQGTILDRIDYNIELVASQSSSATRHIRKAEQHQRSGRAGKVILFLVVMICLLVR